MNTLLDRFCRYVRIDTQADEKATTYPSSVGQLELGCVVLVRLDERGVEELPGRVRGVAPVREIQPRRNQGSRLGAARNHERRGGIGRLRTGFGRRIATRRCRLPAGGHEDEKDGRC